MILTCPACSTRYLVGPAALGDDGRRVRCARCQHTWFETPPPPEEQVETEEDTDEDDVAEPVARREADDDFDEPEAPPPPKRRAGARPQLPALREREKRKGRIAWIIFLLVLVGLLAAAYFFRQQIVTAWPPAAKLYSTIGLETAAEFGLDIKDIKWSYELQGGKNVLVVTGQVNNVAKTVQKVPPVRVILFDGNKRVLHHWTAQPQNAEIGPGQSTGFRARLENPPDTAKSLTVTFGDLH